jgi:lactoylglutathione lyase
MKPDDLYHTGIVVDDLDATLNWFTLVAGYRWTDVVDVDQTVLTPSGEVSVPMRMAYSGDDPRVEILQTIPTTVWTPAPVLR